MNVIGVPCCEASRGLKPLGQQGNNEANNLTSGKVVGPVALRLHTAYAICAVVL
jgi:hypothetical protein